MATPPVEAIPTWATSGTGIAATVDPGAGIRADGWAVNQRPPAGWWNWIWNACGKWLTYLDTLGTEHEVRLDDLDTLKARMWRANALTTFREHAIFHKDGAGATDKVCDIKFSNVAGDGGLPITVIGGLWESASSTGSVAQIAYLDAIGGVIHPVEVTTAATPTNNVECVAIPANDVVLAFQANGDVHRFVPSTSVLTARTALPTSPPVVADANGSGVTVVATLTVVYRSADNGGTWTTPVIPGGMGNIRNVKWDVDASLFVLLCADGYATSPDGATWTDRTSISANPTLAHFDVVFHDDSLNYFMVLLDGSGNLIVQKNTSLTSGTFTAAFAGTLADSNNDRPRIVKANGGLVIHSRTVSAASADGTTWQEIRNGVREGADDTRGMVFDVSAERYMFPGAQSTGAEGGSSDPILYVSPVIWEY